MKIIKIYKKKNVNKALYNVNILLIVSKIFPVSFQYRNKKFCIYKFLTI